MLCFPSGESAGRWAVTVEVTPENWLYFSFLRVGGLNERMHMVLQHDDWKPLGFGPASWLSLPQVQHLCKRVLDHRMKILFIDHNSIMYNLQPSLWRGSVPTHGLDSLVREGGEIVEIYDRGTFLDIILESGDSIPLTPEALHRCCPSIENNSHSLRDLEEGKRVALVIRVQASITLYHHNEEGHLELRLPDAPVPLFLHQLKYEFARDPPVIISAYDLGVELLLIAEKDLTSPSPRNESLEVSRAYVPSTVYGANRELTLLNDAELVRLLIGTNSQGDFPLGCVILSLACFSLIIFRGLGTQICEGGHGFIRVAVEWFIGAGENCSSARRRDRRCSSLRRRQHHEKC